MFGYVISHSIKLLSLYNSELMSAEECGNHKYMTSCFYRTHHIRRIGLSVYGKDEKISHFTSYPLSYQNPTLLPTASM